MADGTPALTAAEAAQPVAEAEKVATAKAIPRQRRRKLKAEARIKQLVAKVNELQTENAQLRRNQQPAALTPDPEALERAVQHRLDRERAAVFARGREAGQNLAGIYQQSRAQLNGRMA